MSQNSIVRLEDPRVAGEFLRRVSGGNASQADRTELALRPEAVCQALAFGNEALGIGGRTARRCADMLVGAVGDDSRAGKLLQDHLPLPRLVELASSSEDLDSAVALVIPISVLIAAVQTNVRASSVRLAGHVFVQWGRKVALRNDRDEVLAHEVGGSPFRDWLIAAAWHAAQGSGFDDPPDVEDGDLAQSDATAEVTAEDWRSAEAQMDASDDEDDESEDDDTQAQAEDVLKSEGAEDEDDDPEEGHREAFRAFLDDIGIDFEEAMRVLSDLRVEHRLPDLSPRLFCFVTLPSDETTPDAAPVSGVGHARAVAKTVGF